ncbi:ABC transporter ATP-binding protein [Desulfomonile tiedjei]|uniref:ABC-type transport system involved in resistance to organic solvents, ATPase component n=1 Tax=Desulfomonile tiedjei (strain ATCC 49306 / DSM 6799 / DCB-1) TaxID=706587 RepID=I4CCX8_DESTA|nr:ABC transporter ATP-binding protein [Desulfomonile tiedjei]AFM27419.1 ABC-type transport system involved in resistance to organic solvents, ATPase component [Desulfomonile tiedjei DSM 6799]
MISIKDVRKQYGEEVVLDRVNLEIKKNSVSTIIGGSGEGKSVLLRLMIGLEPPDSGEILIDGDNIVGMRESELNRIRRRFGVLFQDSALFDFLTVGENVAFPVREHLKLSEQEIQNIVQDKLAGVGLSGEEDKTPEQLSGGMRKRVALARALALDPDIVFFDEPTTGLDPVTSTVIFNLILKTHSERPVTYVLVSHDVQRALEFSQEVMMLYGGQIVAHGKPSEIRKDPDHPIQRFMEGTFGTS